MIVIVIVFRLFEFFYQFFFFLLVKMPKGSASIFQIESNRLK